MIYAFWIIPKRYLNKSQTPVPAVEITHIDFVIEHPEMFGLTFDSIQKTYDKYGEKLRFEGKARDEIIYDLLQYGFVRVRKDVRSDTWTFNVGDFSLRDIKEYVESERITGKKGRLVPEFEDLFPYLISWRNKIKRFIEHKHSDIFFLSTSGESVKITAQQLIDMLKYLKEFVKQQPRCESCKYGGSFRQLYLCGNKDTIKQQLEAGTKKLFFLGYAITVNRNFICERYEMKERICRI